MPPPSQTPSPPLTILITGAGIAGLAAAAALRRACPHAHITLHERSALAHEIGAAIHLCPNASRGLLPWGLDPVRARFVTAKTAYRAYGGSAEVFRHDDMGGMEARFGAPWFWCHRVDLHDELRRLALGEGVGVRLRSEVMAYDPEAGSITLANGTTVTADLVIAADGVHTKAAAAVLGSHNPAMPTNHFAYRFLIPSSELAADPETAHFLENDDGRMKFFVGEGKRLVWYPCRNNEVQNFVAIFHDDEKVFVEDWNTPVDKTALLDRYKDFHPSILAVFNKAKEVKQWPLLFRAPIPSWHKGKLVLIGDAAHPMLPHQGQGGAQAIEDAIALGIAMSNLPNSNPETISHRLKLFEKIRINRASVMQIFSNQGQEEAEKMKEAALKFIPAELVPKSPEDFFRFNFGYDVVKDSERIMIEDDAMWRLPGAFVSVKNTEAGEERGGGRGKEAEVEVEKVEQEQELPVGVRLVVAPVS